MPSGGSSSIQPDKAAYRLIAFEAAIKKDKLEAWFNRNGFIDIGIDDLNYTKLLFKEAEKWGLTVEWFMYFIGGIELDKKSIKEAANDAAIEWDF